MRSSTSSSDARFVAALLLTFTCLLVSWEVLLRSRGSATVDYAIVPPDVAADKERGEEWVVFGNCLMITGVSPKRLDEHLADQRARRILNIARHEQSPLAFFDYLRRTGHYPDVVIANVSSWLNGTNFDQEAALLTEADPLGLGAAGASPPGEPPAPAGEDQAQAFREGGDLGHGELQRRAEDELSRLGNTRLFALGHRYHLFDYSLFLWTLATKWNLDDALYQLNMQSWFSVTESETDGLGYLGLHVRYREDWPRGLDRMAERSLQRMRLSNLLTATYWARLEDHVQHFQARGTHVVLVRMPEHPRIRAFNEGTYAISERLRGLEERTGVSVLDLSHLGPADGVRLFDAVHPDAQASEVISRELGIWMRARARAKRGSDADRRAGGG